jgi:hypothetical protein
LECGKIARENFEAAGIEGLENVFAGDDVNGGAMFAAGFGEEKRAVGKIESGEIVFAANFCGGGFPVETASDHEVEDDPEIVVEAEGDAFADAAKFADGVVVGVGDWRRCSAKQEGRGDADLLQRLVDDARFESGDVGGDVGELGHGSRIGDLGEGGQARRRMYLKLSGRERLVFIFVELAAGLFDGV